MLGKRIKIAVAIDTSPFSVAVLDEAMFYTRIFDAELKVILVEDITIMNAARSPLVRSVNLFSFTSGSIDSEEVEDIYALQRSKAQDTLKYASEKNHIKAALDVRRGKVTEEIIRAASDCDALIVGWAGWRFAKYYYSTHMLQKQSRFRFPTSTNVAMGNTAKHLLEKYPKSIFALKGAIFKSSKTMLYYDGSELSKRTLNGFLTYMFTVKNKTSTAFSILLANKSLRDEAYLAVSSKDASLNPSFFTLSDGDYREKVDFIKDLVANTKTTILILHEGLTLLKEVLFYDDVTDLASSLVIIRG